MPDKLKKILPMLGLAPLVVSGFIFSDMGTFHTPDKISQKVYSSITIGQTFVPKFSNLTMIGVFINKEDLKGEGKITFHLKPSIDSNSDLVKVEVKNSDICDNWKLFRFPPTSDKNNYLYFFRFAPISDSKNKSFYFFLEYSGRNKDDGIRFGITERLFEQGDSGGRSYFDSKSQKWYLMFQTYCAWTGTGKEAFREILNRFSMDRQFAVFYSILCFLILSALIYVSLLIITIRKGNKR